ncbi:hypothetical protein Rs2_08286 [Raphanus sativus]|nr:hypothetical protein Rs2_08286 [Raphanus sativus]
MEYGRSPTPGRQRLRLDLDGGISWGTSSCSCSNLPPSITIELSSAFFTGGRHICNHLIASTHDILAGKVENDGLLLLVLWLGGHKLSCLETSLKNECYWSGQSYHVLSRQCCSEDLQISSGQYLSNWLVYAKVLQMHLFYDWITSTTLSL